MLQTFHAGKLRNHHRAILAQIQVTPLPRTVVVARTRQAALRTRQLMAVLANYRTDFLRLMRKRHLTFQGAWMMSFFSWTYPGVRERVRHRDDGLETDKTGMNPHHLISFPVE